jgi:hypothetical protein
VNCDSFQCHEKCQSRVRLKKVHEIRTGDRSHNGWYRRLSNFSIRSVVSEKLRVYCMPKNATIIVNTIRSSLSSPNRVIPGFHHSNLRCHSPCHELELQGPHSYSLQRV